ncbi:MAG TPA: glutathione peroxidase [Gammaproteobacteria bacterium]|jgi:glutathione peroxidase|nr:glutathione peroxidase [Gammaproteobacteria bacterium]HBK75273.1 glutathione peroxidase [Gammaproteobacteria bacterium]HHZ73482.1 glutathione peroxidase [Gammaproteobacteria bacterium]HIB07009.1 glutathione peroxidase [Gammaproteobacteria bacterium]HIB81132.1 glutathione peroxidase [Gammaproteobacteria bacterium]
MKIDYNTTIELISGRIIDLSEFRGKVLLICNTASRCGYTPQYAELEQLYRSYKEKGLEILGFPCNQFRRQEPGTGAEILDFCQRHYDVSFQMCAKIRVNGEGAHLLFQRLKKARRGLLGSQRITWNFTKFLVGRDGEVLARYGTRRSPSSLDKAIEKALKD